MKRLRSFDPGETNNMREQSQKIRSAGMEEPEKENQRAPAENGERPGPTETSEPPGPNGQDQDNVDPNAPGGVNGMSEDGVIEPPEPREKSPEEMAMDPQALLDGEVDQAIMDEMGVKKAINDAIGSLQDALGAVGEVEQGQGGEEGAQAPQGADQARSGANGEEEPQETGEGVDEDSPGQEPKNVESHDNDGNPPAKKAPAKPVA